MKKFLDLYEHLIKEGIRLQKNTSNILGAPEYNIIVTLDTDNPRQDIILLKDANPFSYEMGQDIQEYIKHFPKHLTIDGIMVAYNVTLKTDSAMRRAVFRSMKKQDEYINAISDKDYQEIINRGVYKLVNNKPYSRSWFSKCKLIVTPESSSKHAEDIALNIKNRCQSLLNTKAENITGSIRKLTRLDILQSIIQLISLPFDRNIDGVIQALKEDINNAMNINPKDRNTIISSILKSNIINDLVNRYTYVANKPNEYLPIITNLLNFAFNSNIPLNARISAADHLRKTAAVSAHDHLARGYFNPQSIIEYIKNQPPEIRQNFNLLIVDDNMHSKSTVYAATIDLLEQLSKAFPTETDARINIRWFILIRA